MNEKDNKSEQFTLSRRKVLKGIVGLGVATSCAPEILAASVIEAGQNIKKTGKKSKKFTTFRSSCAMECLHCNLTAFVHDGKVEKVEASNGFNVKGCARGLSRTKWITHKDRIASPLLRIGEKGTGKFKQISWKEALDLIEKNIRLTIAEEGNKGLFVTTHAGNMDSIKNNMALTFFNYLGGATHKAGSLCCSAVTAAMVPMLGFRYADTRDTIADSTYLLCWGNNPAITMHAYFKEYTKAKRNNAKIVVIDPRFNETAAKGDEWVPITPGTDTALALGMINIIIKEKLINEPFLKKSTGAVYLVDKGNKLVREDNNDANSYIIYDLSSKTYKRHDVKGINPALHQKDLPKNSTYKTTFELIRKEASIWDIKKVADETGIPKKTINSLARDYAKSPRSMIIQNMSGAQRTEFGSYVAGSQFYLALLTGQIGRKGTGICDAGGATQMAKFNPAVPPAKNVEKIAKIPVSRIGQCILDENPHKIQFWYTQTLGVLTQLPNTNVVKEAMKKVRFVVVADNIMSSATQYADLVLPVTTIFEDDSLMAGTRSHYVQLMEKAVEPYEESKPDYWIFARLAERFGFGKVFNQPIEHYINNVLAGTGITLEQLKKGPVKPIKGKLIPFKDGNFRTPTTKAHFFVEDWQKKGYSPIVKYYPVKESPTGSPKLAKKYPLMAVQRKLARSIHSSHGTNEWILEIFRTQPEVLINIKDAKDRNIKNGTLVTVYNDRGKHKALAVVTTHIKKGVICLDNGWWEEQGGSSSYITSDHVEPLGNGHCCNSTLVNIVAG